VSGSLKNSPFILMLVLPFLERGSKDTLDIARKALDGGVDAIQLREKGVPAGSFLQVAEGLYPICKQYNSLLIINDRLDIAMMVDADGVHLPVAGLPPEQVREIAGDEMLVGRSAHNLEEVREAVTGGCDYCILGPVFETPSKAGILEPLGVDGLGDICNEVDIPIIAIGGIGEENARACLEAGASGIAVMRAITDARDVRGSARVLKKAITL